MKSKRVILIGGAPTVGKSYLARKLAESLNLPWISTDTIREQMRKLVRKEDYPALFDFSEPAITAEKFLTENTSEEVVQSQNEESLEVWKGVEALVETDYVWRSFIVEGVAILPAPVAKLTKKNKNVKGIFMVDEDRKRIREIIYTRGLWDEADKYPDSVKEKELEWVLEFNEYIKEECRKFNLPVIYVGDRNSYVEEVKSLIK